MAIQIPDERYDAPLARLILVLSLAPTIGLGIGRFAYSLVLPDMRDSLGWSYAAAGFLNTINAAGYLGGALIASKLCNRFGLARVLRDGTLACVAALILSGVSGNFVLLSFARLLIGVGAAVAFVAGGAMAAQLAQAQPARASLLLSLFYAGPGFGVFASGALAPFMLQYFGPGSWWIVWLAMAAISIVMMIVLLLNSVDAPATVADAAPGNFAIRPVLARGQSGTSTAIILGFNAIGAALPLLSQSAVMLAASAVVFGVSFFAVVTATTAYIRFNYPTSLWPSGIAAMTIAFGIGQTLGPIATGMITDATGSLTSGLGVSAAALVAGAVAVAFQRPLKSSQP